MYSRVSTLRRASRRGGTATALTLAVALTLSAFGGTAASATEEEPLPFAEVGFTALAGGANQNLALGVDGRAYGWGFNGQGRVGDSTTETRLSPVLLDSNAPFVQVAAGNAHSLGVTADGKVYAWGAGTQGKLGDGTMSDHLSPALASALPQDTTFVQVDAGKYHSLALADTGVIYGWGANGQGQLGNGTIAADVSIPTPVANPAGVQFAQVSGGEQHTLALAVNGTVYAWGHNRYGQLGDGTTETRTAPVAVSFGTALPEGVTIVAVAAAESGFSLALASDGTAYAWGYNNNGQLGNGTTANALVPTAVAAPEGASFESIDAGRNWSIGRTSDGRILAWGNNRYGQFGNGEGGTGVSSATPVALIEPEGVDLVQVFAGANHGLAIGDDSKTYAWGSSNSYLGNGTTTDTFVPTEVLLPVAYAPDTIPELLSANLSGTRLTVTWSDATADGYRVRVHPTTGDDTVLDVAGDQTNAQVEDLTPGASYEVSVAARNWVGAGRASAVQTVSVPSAATKLTATAKGNVYGTKTTIVAQVTPKSAAGTVAVKIGSKTYSAQASGGQAIVTLPAKVRPAGKHALKVAFSPATSEFAASTAQANYTVAKTKPASIKTTAAAFKKNTKPVVTVKVGKLADGSYPSGKVTVKVGSVQKTVALKAAHRGSIKVTLAKKYAKSITVRATFAPTDTKNVSAVTAKALKVKVKK